VRADREGPALQDWGADRRLQGSEGVRVVRSRSDEGGPKGVRTGPSGSEGGPSGSEPFDLNRTEGNQTEGK
jgi:hypothetical protein